MTIGVFGAWRPAPGDSIYRLAVDYGTGLAAAGHDVLTGGYSGVMEAASRGAADAGGRTVGVTCPEIDRLLPVNRWVREESKASDLKERLAICFRRIDAAVFFPGRSGTITELALALELREKGLLQHPVFMTSDFWDDYLALHAAMNARLPYPTSKSANVPLYIHCSSPQQLVNHLEGRE